METTLPLPFLTSVSVPPGLAKLEGLNREEVSILGTPFFEAAPGTFEKLTRFLGRHNYEFYAHMDVTSLDSSDEVIALLDKGTRKVFVTPESLSEYTEFGSRVLPATSKLDLSAASEHGLLIKEFDPSAPDAGKFAEDAKSKKISNLYLKPVAGANLEQFVSVCKQANAIPVLPSTGLTTDKDDTSRLLVSKVIASFWTSDRADGLIPTVVTSESGVALGLAYTSEESILEAIKTQGGVYQSRKRGLWVKGLTSGDTQELVRIALDCDNDTLKFVVRQTGRFCHLEQFKCFGDLQGIAGLERTLRSRKESAPEGSYTARLFSDEKLLRAKIMEEAEELCDRVAIIDRGRIVAVDTPAGLKRRVGSGSSFLIETTPFDPEPMRSLPGMRGMTARPADGHMNIRMVLDDESVIADVISSIVSSGARVIGLSKNEPTLEDAFMHLVGRGLE